jgi:CHAT domain-containing protein
MMISGGLLAAPLPPAATGEALVIADSAQEQLKGIREQAQTVQTKLGLSTDRVLIDDPSSVNTLLQLRAAPQMLHLSAHTIQREQDARLFSALLLLEHPLSVEQSYDLALSGTKLVTLIGCSTGQGLQSGGGLLAFQSAFLVAGAHRVINTLWAVHAEDTEPFAKQLYTHLAAGVPVAAALRQTQHAFLKDPKLSHPGVWAAFTSNRR